MRYTSTMPRSSDPPIVLLLPRAPRACARGKVIGCVVVVVFVVVVSTKIAISRDGSYSSLCKSIEIAMIISWEDFT